MKQNNKGLKPHIKGQYPLINYRAIFFAIFLFLIVPLFIVSQSSEVCAKETKELYEIVPASAKSLVYFKDLEGGLKPLLKSDFYNDVKNMSLFEGPIKTDVSAPILSLLGDVEEALGMKMTIKRILYAIGKRAVFYETEASGRTAWVSVLETGWFKGLIIDILSQTNKSIVREEVLGFSPWVINVQGKKLYYKRLSEYIIVSNSPHALLSQWEVIAGTNTNTLSQDPDFIKYLTALKDKSNNDSHIMLFHRMTEPKTGETGLLGRAERLMGGNESLFLGVIFTDLGADVYIYSPYAPDNSGADLRALEGRKNLNLKNIPGETAVLVAFSAFDPEVIYSIFYQNWFYDVGERIRYLSIVNKWKLSSGFDIEGGILKNLDGGAFFALTGLGYEGREPHLLTMASFGIKDNGEDKLISNLSSLSDYAFRDEGPNILNYGGAEIHYMGQFRESEIEWSGREYIRPIKANPGFALKGERLYLFRDASTMTRLIDIETLSVIEPKLKDQGDLFSSDFLLKTKAFSDSQTDLSADNYDLYLFVNGENSVSLLETYIVNLSAHYKYFLYRDAEKRFLPFLEHLRRSFVSFYGGINFEGEAIAGEFRLVVRDLD